MTLSFDSNIETYKCDWIDSSITNVTLEMLNYECENNSAIINKNGLEGEYYFWYYSEDELGNYNLNKLDDLFKIDTKQPEYTYQIFQDNSTYRNNNKISFIFIDLNNIVSNSINHKWFIKDHTVSSKDLIDEPITDNEVIYPEDYYGLYELWIYVEDEFGNYNLSKLPETFYIDSEPLNIFLNGEDNIKILLNQEYIEDGALAYRGDYYNADREENIYIQGEVDTSKPGIYQIIYYTQDGENIISVTRTIEVEDSKVLYYYIFASFVVGFIIFIVQIYIQRKTKVWYKSKLI